VPFYALVVSLLAQIFIELADPQGLENRWLRSIWKAVIGG
jgi:hypothetical protein